MEVHHHSHTTRNKWTHYFWEFLMLFLAVFCGFLAEYQLEHKIERDRSKELARSLYNDLRNDTIELRRIIDWEKNKLSHIDSLRGQLLKTILWNDTSFSVHLATMAFVSRFFQNNGTYEQLKNSGSLRYFKQDIVNLLHKYQNYLSEARLREEAESVKLEQRIIPLVEEMINYEFLYTLLTYRANPSRVYVDMEDQKKKNLLLNIAIEMRMISFRRLGLYTQLYETAIEILGILMKRYHTE